MSEKGIWRKLEGRSVRLRDLADPETYTILLLNSFWIDTNILVHHIRSFGGLHGYGPFELLEEGFQGVVESEDGKLTPDDPASNYRWMYRVKIGEHSILLPAPCFLLVEPSDNPNPAT